MVTPVPGGPLDIVVPPESWETPGPEEARGTAETKARPAPAWTGRTGTRASKDPKVCLVWAKTAKTAPTASLGCPGTLAFLVLLVRRGPPASVTPRLAKEP